jgi:excisionase family DNA binding protein
MSKKPPYLTPEQAAKRVGLKVDTIRYWCRHRGPDRLPAFLMGGRWFIDPADLDRWNQYERPPGPRPAG